MTNGIVAVGTDAALGAWPRWGLGVLLLMTALGIISMNLLLAQ
jgi:hypothetical protein